MLTPTITDSDFTLHIGDIREIAWQLEPGSVHSIVTSPPYWNQRDYGHDDQLGHEKTPEEFVSNLAAVFAPLSATLHPHGTLWLNIGDSYLDKDLQLIPALLAFALKTYGWVLRADVIWNKPDALPESVTDRPSSSHEHLLLFSKQAVGYWYDWVAISEEAAWERWGKQRNPKHSGMGKAGWIGDNEKATLDGKPKIRNRRDVWSINTNSEQITLQRDDEHPAIMPKELARLCIEAGTPPRVCSTCGHLSSRIVERSGDYAERRDAGEAIRHGLAGVTAATGEIKRLGDPEVITKGWTECGHDSWRPGVVLDPFMGSGTTALVAREQARRCVGVELKPAYGEQIAARTRQLSLLA